MCSVHAYSLNPFHNCRHIYIFGRHIILGSQKYSIKTEGNVSYVYTLQTSGQNLQFVSLELIEPVQHHKRREIREAKPHIYSDVI
jgi:hypothetical protein